MARLEVGDKAPLFSLPCDDDSSFSLRDCVGKRVLLYFYPADDTPGCTKEACQFNDLLSAFKRAHVDVIGISPDSPATHRKFREKYKLNFPLLSDPLKTVLTKYGAYGEKQLYGKTVVGVIRSTFVISPFGKIEHAWSGIRASGHAERVRQEILG